MPNMKSKIVIGLCMAIVGLGSCSRKDAQSSDADESNMRNIKTSTLQLDSIPVDYFESSVIGFLDMRNDTIYMFDQKFSWIFRFTKDGKLIDRLLGLGEGPKECNMGPIRGYCFDGDKVYIFDDGLGYTLYTNTFDRKRRMQINRGDIKNRDDYESPRGYTMNDGNLIIKKLDHHIYYTVVGFEYHADDFDNAIQKYFQNTHVLAKLNVLNGDVEKMLGHYPSFYDGNHNAFYNMYFDINKKDKQFLVTYDADSLIYCYDTDFQPLYSFGFAGENVKTDYKKISVEAFVKARGEFREKYTYYHHLKYLPELDMLFRSYTRPDSEKQDGLQIYQGKTLLADVSVPKKMYVLGYSATYVYATSGLDEMSESFALYRFKIK